MILFKEPHMKEEFWQLDCLLQVILCDIACWVKRKYGEDTTLTDLIRSHEQQLQYLEDGKTNDAGGVHVYHRGTDLRKYKNPEANNLQWVNDKYPYDPTRPWLQTIIIDDNKDHHHVQVCNFNYKVTP